MIIIHADTRQATVDNKEILTSGSAGIQVHYELSEDWNDLVKVAVFRNDDDSENTQIDVALTDELTCVIPAENLTHPDKIDTVVYAGIYGTDGHGTVIIPTVWVSLGPVREGAVRGNASGADPTPDMWAQLQYIAEHAGEENALDAEAWAVGERGGTEVSDTDPTYHNNAKYYSGVAGDHATDAGNAQTAAETAQGLAETAQGLAEVAQGKAEDAQEAAEVAQGLAETAQGKAEDAQEAAEAAQGLAEVAQGKAEDAQEAAETAQGKAEDAQEAAEAAAAVFVVDDELSNSSENPVQNKVIYTALGGKVDTVAGKGLSTNDYTDSEKTKLSGIEAGAEVNVQADWNQSSSGADDYIKNKPANLVSDASYVHTDNNYTSDEKTKLAGIEAGAEVNDVTSVAGKTGAVTLDADDVAYDSTETYTSGTVGKELSDQAGAISALNSAINTKADVIVDSVGPAAIASFPDGADNMPIREITATIEPVQDLHGYSNPWPPGGGANKLVSGTWVVGQYNGGAWSGDLTRRTSEYCPISPNVQYTMSIDPNENKNLAWINYNYFDENKQWLGSRSDNGDTSFNGQRTHTFTITNSSAKYVRLTARAYSSSGLDISTWDIDAALPQLNEGASVITPWTPYENNCPISGHTGCDVHVADGENPHVVDNEYPITFPDAAGTVYGGTLTVNEDGTGALTVDWASETLISITQLYNFTQSSQYGSFAQFTPTSQAYSELSTINCNCSMAKGVSYNGRLADPDVNRCFTELNIVDIRAKASANITTKEALFNYFEGAQIVYKLKTPLVYNLTAEQVGAVITTLYGNNNVWADTGDVSLDYRADTKKYIDKKLAELVAQIVNS